MGETETIEKFYKLKFNREPDRLPGNMGHFNVFRVEECVGHGKQPVEYSRRDYYKIAFMRGHHLYHYADKTLEVNGDALLFFNPDIPYTFEPLTQEPSGYFCIFKETFFSEYMRNSLSTLPMYQIGGKPAFILDKKHSGYICDVFEKMLAERDSDYRFKYDLIRNYVMEIVHHALKMDPADSLYQHTDANARITAVFRELLERQFPIESPAQRFKLRRPGDCAQQLAIHVNHLNRAIRVTTGKTTTAHISERLLSEAKALLKHTSWNIAEVSYSLGFENPAHFNHFFKKQTSSTPSAFRG